MNSKERVLCAIERSPADRIPIYDSFWQDTLIRWRSEGLDEEIEPEDFFDFDIHVMGIDASPRFEPELLAEEGEMITIRDRFGYVVRKQRLKSRTMQFLSHPVTNEQQWQILKEKFTIDPDAPARADYSPFPFRLDMGTDWDKVRSDFAGLRDKGRYILGSAYGPHEAILRMHGFESTLYSLCDRPEMLRDMAETYADFLISVIGECLKQRIHFDGFFMIEDLAGTNGMLFSPDQWRSVFRPSVERIGCFLKEKKMNFWMHSCGNAEPVYRDLIECGVQVLNPLEAKSGLDVRELKNKYGKELTFFGNIDVMKMAESQEQLKVEIAEKISAAKVGGGYIYHSDHSVPPEVSFERYQYLMTLVRKYGVISQ